MRLVLMVATVTNSAIMSRRLQFVSAYNLWGAAGVENRDDSPAVRFGMSLDEMSSMLWQYIQTQPSTLMHCTL